MKHTDFTELLLDTRIQAEKLNSSELSRIYGIRRGLKKVINETVTVRQFEDLYPVIKEASYKLSNRNDA